MLQECYRDVTWVVSGLLEGCYRDVAGFLKGYYRGINEYYMGVT